MLVNVSNRKGSLLERKQSQREAPASKEAVRVMTRVRPFNSRELGGTDISAFPNSIICMDGNTVHVVDDAGNVKDSFEFHECFWSIPDSQKQYSSNPFADQVAVYEKTGVTAVEAALKGYHCCIFAYGQTGSGKTYSMLGSEADPGIAPRIVDDLFAEVEKVQGKAGYKYSISISFMEIYNEKCKDLLLEEFDFDHTEKDKKKSKKARRKGSLNKRGSTASGDPGTPMAGTPSTGGNKSPRKFPTTSSGGRKGDLKRRSTFKKQHSHTRDEEDHEHDFQELRVRHSPAIGVFVEGLTRLGPEQGLICAEDVKRVIKSGMEYRATAETSMNPTSSRSHAVFQIQLTGKNQARGVQRYAHVNLVDLAGSERIKMSKVAGARLVEATRINLSLSTLRRVIDCLIDNATKKKGKILPPYRDSMLTWVLSESLGGNSKTMMLATISPHESNYEDTTNTLKYALKAKAIVNNVRVNEEKASVLVSAMQAEIEALREQMEADGEGNCEELEQEIQDREAEMAGIEAGMEAVASEVAQTETQLKLARVEAGKKEREVEKLKAEGLEAKHELEASRVMQVSDALNMEQENLQERAEETRLALELKQQEELKKAEAETLKEQVDQRQKLFSNEVLHTRRKQFQWAFQAAFMKVRANVKFDAVKHDLRSLTSVTTQINNDIEKKCELIDYVNRQNSHMKERVRRIDNEIEITTMTKTTEERKTEGIVHLMQDENKVIIDEGDKLIRTLDKKVTELNSLRDEHQRVSKQHETTIRNLRAKVETAEKETSAKGELHSELERQLVLINKETTSLKTEIQQMRSAKELMTASIRSKRGDVALLNEENETSDALLVSLTTKLNVDRGELDILKDNLMGSQASARAWQEKHKELKESISHRYFPASQTRSLTLQATNGMSRSGSPTRFRSPTREREWVGDTLHYATSRTLSPPKPPMPSRSPSPGMIRKTSPKRSVSPTLAPLEHRHNSALYPPPRYAGRIR
eukprot:TRINITY_DN407_c0_g2_i1.p1 TRINITY_DN407_c0_g2~~TRINITY_DN407_c0_g2_i1.p1  ORF type:complete len:985 (+),score=214.08 TRINITY_DN407_c0_g2_i1:1085-4039(+)